MARGETKIRDQADTPTSCSGAVGAHGRTSPIPRRASPTRSRRRGGPGTRQTVTPEGLEPEGGPGGWAKHSANDGDGTCSTLAASGIIIRVDFSTRETELRFADTSSRPESGRPGFGNVWSGSSVVAPPGQRSRLVTRSESRWPSSSSSESGLGPREDRPNAASLGPGQCPGRPGPASSGLGPRAHRHRAGISPAEVCSSSSPAALAGRVGDGPRGPAPPGTVTAAAPAHPPVGRAYYTNDDARLVFPAGAEIQIFCKSPRPGRWH